MHRKNNIIYYIMSSAALSAAKARRATPGGVNRNESETHDHRKLNASQRQQPQLPPVWEVLTCHDKDLKVQQSQNEKFSAQIVDLIEVVSSVQEQINKLADLKLKSKLEEVRTRIKGVEAEIRADKSNLSLETEMSKSDKN